MDAQTAQDLPQEPKDSFEMKLDSEVQNLQNCQAQHNLQSCYPCENFLDCQTRKNYVKAVYDNFSKGTGGDFDFN